MLRNFTLESDGRSSFISLSISIVLSPYIKQKAVLIDGFLT